MKKTRLIPLLILVFLLMLAAIWHSHPQPFDQIYQRGTWAEWPHGTKTLTTLNGPVEGPPPTPEMFQSYRALMRLLDGHRYRARLPGLSALFSPAGDGIGLVLLEGCSPSILGYWSKGTLWLPTSHGRWRGFTPTNAAQFGRELEELAAQYG